MLKHISALLFIYSEKGEDFLELITNNPFDTVITTARFEDVCITPQHFFETTSHVVVAGSMECVKEVMQWSMEYDCSLGFLPLPQQKALASCYGIPKDEKAMLSLALSNTTKPIDIVLCNETITLFKATIGRIPLADSLKNTSTVRVIVNGLKKITSLNLLPFTITTTGKNPTKTITAACGCIVLETPEKGFVSKLIAHDCSFVDGMVSTVIVAPFSLMDYFKLMWLKVFSNSKHTSFPHSVGYIKGPQVTIDSAEPLAVTLDGEKATTTPAHFQVYPGALKVNHGLKPDTIQSTSKTAKERCNIAALPAGKELQKAQHRKIPFFTYASEERFKDLFIALKDDGAINSAYIVLMVLSTILATVGLYLNSASVIIGAMLLAPLMAPIISLAMSLLRHNRKLSRQSLQKITLGIFLALFTSALLTLLSPYQPFTAEMEGRLNPTMLDLTVAIAAGIAGAYTKSYKEILQSLAGVAIAVALVPPLAVAGTGLGRLDPYIFGQAFLLFSTNLIGIVLAATFTFRILGFSPVVRHKQGVLIVFFSLLIISIPLVMAFNNIVARAQFEKSWELQRFYVNGKYLIVKEATLHTIDNNRVLTVDIHARDQLYRKDLNAFKQKVKRHIMDDLVIRAKITYIP